MSRLEFCLPARQLEAVNALSRVAGCSVAECLRRFLDHALNPPVLDALFPSLSGQVQMPARNGD